MSTKGKSPNHKEKVMTIVKQEDSEGSDYDSDREQEEKI
jgi:hypothetical protein